MRLLLLFGISAVISWLLCFPVHRLLVRFNIVDRPNERSSHVRPTARGGGIAIFLALTLVWPLLGFEEWSHHAIWLLAGALVVVSFVDDIKSLSPLLRFGCQTLVAASALLLFDWPGWVSVHMTSAGLVALASVAAFFWVVGYTNVFNFMDGINGLAGSQAVVAAGGGAILAGLASGDWSHPAIQLSLVLSGAASGFLPHNAGRARLFLGDVGSVPLGFLIAILGLWLVRDLGWQLLPVLVLLNANFICDAGITLLRRLRKGERWWRPHREHFYQRLVRSGFSHQRVTAFETGLQGMIFGLLLLFIKYETIAPVYVIVLVISVWLAFFWWVERIYLNKKQGDA